MSSADYLKASGAHHSKGPAVRPFALERYFAKYEFSAPYLLSPSDSEARTLADILSLGDSECRTLWHSLGLGYTESRGLPALRDAIARFVSESSGLTAGAVTADDILVFSCAEEAIYTVARVLVQASDRVACTWPAYQSLYQVASECGATIHPIPARVTGGVWDLSVADIDVAIQSQTRLVIANVPHNPTGMVPSPASWARLCDRTRDAGAFLFADEVYRPLAGAHGVLPASPVTSPEGWSISLGSVSKAFGLAGVRIGWVASKNHVLLNALEQYKDYTTICASAPAEVLALIALRNWRVIVEQQQQIIMKNAQVFAQFTQDFNHLIDPAPIGAGSTCFPSWNGPGTAHEMGERAVTSCGVMVLPGDVFDPAGIGAGGRDLVQRFRVGLGRRAFPDVIDRFSNHLRSTY